LHKKKSLETIDDLGYQQKGRKIKGSSPVGGGGERWGKAQRENNSSPKTKKPAAYWRKERVEKEGKKSLKNISLTSNARGKKSFIVGQGAQKPSES